MDCENDDVKTAFPNKNSLFDDSDKSFHTAEDSLLYINCPRNPDIFMKTCKTAKECAVIKVKRPTLLINGIKYPNYPKASANLGTETSLHHTEKRAFTKKVKSRRKIKSSKNNYITNSHDKKLEDKCLDKNHEEFCEESNSIPKRIKYPNYLKASSKLKERNNLLHPLNNKLISQTENGDEKVLSDNCYLLIKDRQIKLQAIIEENEKLKNKLKTVIESLREILVNYDETDSEIKLFKDDSSCQKKQAKCPNDHFTFTLKDRSSPLKNTDVFKRTNHPVLACQIVPLNDVLYTCESALERTKVQDSTRCLIELERQNRMIIQSLDELKGSFSKITETKSSSNKNHHYRTANRIRTNNFSKSVESPVTVQRKTAAVLKSPGPLKKQSEILREMLKFSNMVKNKEHLIKDNQHLNHKNICKKNADNKLCKMANNDNPQEQDTKIKGEINKHPVLDRLQFRSTGNINKVRQPASSKN